MSIISFGYEARVGKDSASDYLVREYGFTKISFAGPLKQAAKIIYGLTEEQVNGNLKDVEDSFWKETPRSILQKMGTDGLRKGHRDDVWIKAMERKIAKSTKSWVVSDVRFPNEANLIKSLGGAVVKIIGSFGGRKKIISSKHESEVAMKSYDGWDFVIDNDSSLEDFCNKINTLYLRLIL